MTRPRFLAGALCALLVIAIPFDVVGRSPSPSDVPAASSPATVSVPSGFTWKAAALPEDVGADLPQYWAIALPGERTVMAAIRRGLPGNAVMDPIGAVEASGLWWTEDAATWMPVDLGKGKAVGPIAVGPAGLVMASEEGTIRVSADGVTWETIVLPKKARSKLRRVFGIAGTSDGVAVVGETSDYRPAVWTSPDGRSWKLQLLSKAAGFARRVAATSDGRMVAVGSTTTDGTSTQWVWLRGPDGSWSPVEAPWQAADDNESLSVTVGHAGGRFHATVTRLLQGALVGRELWTSSDGMAWESAGDTVGSPFRAMVDGGVVTVGRLEADGPVAVRVSSDWSSWTELDASPFEGLSAYVVAVLHDGRVLVDTFDDSGPRGAWTGTPVP